MGLKEKKNPPLPKGYLSELLLFRSIACMKVKAPHALLSRVIDQTMHGIVKEDLGHFKGI